jgi:hypothetical protein
VTSIKAEFTASNYSRLLLTLIERRFPTAYVIKHRPQVGQEAARYEVEQAKRSD